MTERASRLQGFRERRDHFFGHHRHSPLSAEQQARFTGLSYFPEREDLVFNLTVDESVPGAGEIIELPTSDGRRKSFVRVGRIQFTVDGVQVSLSVLRDTDRGELFIPFQDATSGVESYALGRYLEPQMRPDGTLDVDFNYAYNPFCAYGEGWSCPIPPEENRLSLAIRAGEAAFRDGSADD